MKHNVPKIAVKVRDIHQVRAAMDSGAELIYFAPHFGLESMSDHQWKQLAEINEEFPNLLAYALPVVRQDEKKHGRSRISKLLCPMAFILSSAAKPATYY